jgi:hypothetical protein
VLYERTLCLVAQGRKRAVLGTTAFVHDPACNPVASAEPPVTGAVIEASRDRPYLCPSLDDDDGYGTGIGVEPHDADLAGRNAAADGTARHADRPRRAASRSSRAKSCTGCSYWSHFIGS